MHFAIDQDASTDVMGYCCRNKFEGTLEALSQFETHEAQSLMTEALEAMDMMNIAIILQNEVNFSHVAPCIWDMLFYKLSFFYPNLHG